MRRAVSKDLPTIISLFVRAREYGIVNGIYGDELAPQATASRIKFAAMMLRAHRWYGRAQVAKAARICTTIKTARFMGGLVLMFILVHSSIQRRRYFSPYSSASCRKPQFMMA